MFLRQWGAKRKIVLSIQTTLNPQHRFDCGNAHVQEAGGSVTSFITDPLSK